MKALVKNWFRAFPLDVGVLIRTKRPSLPTLPSLAKKGEVHRTVPQVTVLVSISSVTITYTMAMAWSFVVVLAFRTRLHPFPSPFPPRKLLQPWERRAALIRCTTLSSMFIRTRRSAFLKNRAIRQGTPFLTPSREGRKQTRARNVDLVKASSRTARLKKRVAGGLGWTLGTQLLPCPRLLVTREGRNTAVI